MRTLLLLLITGMAMSCVTLQGPTKVYFDDSKTYESPRQMIFHKDGEVKTLAGPISLEKFLELRDEYKNCNWMIEDNVIHVTCKKKYEHKPHVFKQRGFGNTNHNAPGHVCDETCH